MEIYITPLHDYDVYVAIHSLRYNDDSCTILEVSRERLAQMREEKKKRIDWHNSYIERITHTKANKLLQRQRREEAMKLYDKAIMQKYNVGANYRRDRWFMEQVRPTI